CAYALAARAAVHRQRVQSGAAVVAAGFQPAGASAGFQPAATYLSQRLAEIRTAAQRRSRDYSARALALLRQAVAAGYDNFAHRDTDADLDGLRDEAAFKELLAQGHLDRRYGLVRRVSLTHEAKELHGLDLAEHRRRGRELA